MDHVLHAIFDLDGTLVDSLPGIEWSIQAALARCGLPPLCRDLRPLIGPPIRRILAAVSGVREPERLDRLEYAFRSSYDSGGWRRTRLRAGAAELLEQLRDGGIGLWVVTNKPALATRRILGEWKLAGLFEEIRCRDSRTPPFRSKAETLRELLERRELTPSACLMIGDTAEDCDAAMAAGIDCAVVADGYGADTPLPAGSKRVSGWDEIAERCGVSVCAAERC
ncbi:MAG: HAD hydrolase-like protein [Bryobacteraceae bacterium]